MMEGTKSVGSGNNSSSTSSSNATAAVVVSNLISLRSYRWRMQLGLLNLSSEQKSITHQDILNVLRSRRERFQQRVVQNPYPVENDNDDDDDDEDDDDDQDNDEGAGGTTTTTTAPSAAAIDPLTAMMMEEKQKNDRLQELDLKYRKERARRKRGSSSTTGRTIEDEDYDETAVTLQIIDKDLHRLKHPTSILSDKERQQQKQQQASNENESKVSSSSSSKDTLRQVLFVFHCTYPTVGYRQGMHEIASYLLFTLECDRVDSSLLGSECFAMLEIILLSILPAYDHHSISISTSDNNNNTNDATKANNNNNNTDDKPLEAMSHRILQQVGRIDAPFWKLIQSLNVPGPVFLSKWVRLLFSREVSGNTNVLELWDTFFNYTSTNRNNDSSNNSITPHTWMDVLEATSVARLLHRRAELLHSHDPLHLLMNLPVENDIEPIVEMMKPILLKQTVSLPPIRLQQPLPPPQQQPQHSSSSNAMNPITPARGGGPNHPLTTPGVNNDNALLSSMKGFSISKVTEKLATKTQSISKRLYQEWEAMATDKADEDPLLHNNSRSYDDDVWHTQLRQHQQQQQQQSSFPSPQASVTTSTNYHSSVAAATAATPYAAHPPTQYTQQQQQQPPPYQGMHHQQQQQHPLQPPVAPVPVPQQPTPHHHHHQHHHHHHHQVTFTPQQWGQEMELQLAIMQNFCMTIEKEAHDQNINSSSRATTGQMIRKAKVVPEAVWKALADLEVLRQDIVYHTTTTTTPPPSNNNIAGGGGSAAAGGR